MRISRLAPVCVTLLLAFAMAACDEGPTEPAHPLRFLYLAPPPPLEVAHPEHFAGCGHHFAPASLWLETSWGARLRMESIGVDLFEASFSDVPADREHWVTMVDFRLCAYDAINEPRVTRGLYANGVELKRVVDVPSGPGLAFFFASDGTVVP